MERDGTSCPTAFKQGFFKVFFNEECLTLLDADAMPDSKCPVDLASDFLQAIFGNYHVVALILMPWAWTAYVILLGMSRKPKFESNNRCSGVLTGAWLLLQLVAVSCLVASMVLQVLGYVALTAHLHQCLATVADAAIVHLVLPPMWLLTPSSLNKLGPLLLALCTIPSYFIQMGSPLLVHALGYVVMAVLFLQYCAVVYSVGTLSAVFGLAYVVAALIMVLSLFILKLLVSLVQGTAHMKAVERTLGFSITMVAHHCARRLLHPTTVDNLSAESDAVLIFYTSTMFLMVLSPICVLGGVFAFTTYSSYGFLTAFADIFVYIFNFDDFELLEQLPDFVALHVAIRGFIDDPLSFVEVVADCVSFLDVPPAELLFRGQSLVAVSTIFVSVRTILTSGFALVHFLTDGRCGVQGLRVMNDMVPEDEQGSGTAQSSGQAQRAAASTIGSSTSEA